VARGNSSINSTLDVEAPARKSENMKEMGEKSQRLLLTGKKESFRRRSWGRSRKRR